MQPEAWLDVFRDLAIQIQGKVASLSGTLQARREIRVGAGGDTTTWIDQQAEEIILCRLLSLHGQGENFTLISEELGVKEFGPGGPYLLVDPIDGSLNAKRGIPFFSTSFALVEGETLSGTRAGLVINLANGDQFWAARGRGSFRNGCPLQTQGSERLEILAYEANRPPSDLAILSPLLPFAVR
ncbi:MAG: inositol monophosphatase family protein, partial [candidate division NC10 bacterium]|nr:inositol monophosphatase family protein [candidate division NC10 bacterium]